MLTRSCVLIRTSANQMVLRGSTSILGCPTDVAGVVATMLTLRGLRPRARVSVLSSTTGARSYPLKFSRNSIFAHSRLMNNVLLISSGKTTITLTSHMSNDMPTFTGQVGRQTTILKVGRARFRGPGKLAIPARCSATQSVVVLTHCTVRGGAFHGVMTHGATSIR